MNRFFRTFPGVALVASELLFTACLFSDGYYIEGPNPRAWSSAWGLLLLGWIGLGSGTLAWLANPMLFAAWAFSVRRKHSVAIALAIVALSLMVSFLFQASVISSEAPTNSHIVGYGVGYWLWIASAATHAVGSAIALVLNEPALHEKKV